MERRPRRGQRLGTDLGDPSVDVGPAQSCSPSPTRTRALAFYTEKLGFKVRGDTRFGEHDEMRWLEVAPPGSRARLALNPPMGGEPGGGSIDVETPDVLDEHARLSRSRRPSRRRQSGAQARRLADAELVLALALGAFPRRGVRDALHVANLVDVDQRRAHARLADQLRDRVGRRRERQRGGALELTPFR